MTTFTSDFLRILSERGFIYQGTDNAALDRLCAHGSISGYIGFDCTADSLHVGSLIGIMMLRWLQKTGHRPIAIVGGATTKIGDPSGRDDTRQIITDAQLAANMHGITESLSKYLTFGTGAKEALLVDNDEWLSKQNYIGFLRQIGRHFTINRMLTFDSVKARLEREQPLTFLEFNYMIFQAYDFLELRRRYGCVLQMGGSDQWGNIVNGVELIRRMDNADAFGLTTSLLTTTSGAKMGKTAAGAVWLNESRLSPFDFWQYWRNTEDGDVGRFLRLFTELPMDEIARLEKLSGQEINEAKKILATEVTRLCHGDAAAQKAQQTAVDTFEKGGASVDLPTLTLIVANDGVALVDVLMQAGLAASKGEARRLIQGQGVRLNDTPVANESARLQISDFDAAPAVKLSAGKKRHVLIKRAP